MKVEEVVRREQTQIRGMRKGGMRCEPEDEEVGNTGGNNT